MKDGKGMPKFCKVREANIGVGFSLRVQKVSILLNQTTLTSVALGPLGPWVVSNSTSSPSFRDLNPAPVIAEWWTNTSLLPATSINPKPFWSLNHFTRPFDMITSIWNWVKIKNPPKRETHSLRASFFSKPALSKEPLLLGLLSFPPPRFYPFWLSW